MEKTIDSIKHKLVSYYSLKIYESQKPKASLVFLQNDWNKNINRKTNNNINLSRNNQTRIDLTRNNQTRIKLTRNNQTSITLTRNKPNEHQFIYGEHQRPSTKPATTTKLATTTNRNATTTTSIYRTELTTTSRSTIT